MNAGTDAFSQLRDQLARGFENMRTVDQPFEVTGDDSSFVLNLGQEGEFRVEKDDSGLILFASTPKNPRRMYGYDVESRTWVNSEDGHNLLELLARDAMDLRPGYPDF